jgi:acyl dehydratase
MTQLNLGESENGEKKIYRFTTARRTITETDIVNFVNLVGLHEPPFIDMEFIKESMPESHQKRFAPAPFLISVGMGLVAPIIMNIIAKVSEEEKVGLFMGMVGIKARIQNPVFPGDTLKVDVEASVNRRTSKGHFLIDLRHVVRNQKDEVAVDFVETVMFSRPGE